MSIVELKEGGEWKEVSRHNSQEYAVVAAEVLCLNRRTDGRIWEDGKITWEGGVEK